MDQVSESQPSETQISGHDSEGYKHDVIIIETDSGTEEEEEEEQEEPGQVSVFHRVAETVIGNMY